MRRVCVLDPFLHSTPMAPDSPPTLSVVIPVHNEADYLPGAVVELFEELESVPAPVTVL